VRVGFAEPLDVDALSPAIEKIIGEVPRARVPERDDLRASAPADFTADWPVVCQDVTVQGVARILGVRMFNPSAKKPPPRREAKPSTHADRHLHFGEISREDQTATTRALLPGG